MYFAIPDTLSTLCSSRPVSAIRPPSNASAGSALPVSSLRSTPGPMNSTDVAGPGGGQPDSMARRQRSAVERIGGERFAVQLDALDAGSDELDERGGAGSQATEFDGRLGGECLVVASQVELSVVARFRHDRCARTCLITGEVVPGGYERTLGQAHEAALPGRS